MTFIGVVFSISLVAVRMTSGQLTPRVVRIVLRSWISKLTLTLFPATSLSSLLVLISHEREGRCAADHLGAAGAEPTDSGAGGLSLLLFIAYVSAMLQVVRVVDRIARQVVVLCPRLGLRQLSDLALWAISPAVNDPTTAVQRLDRIVQLPGHGGGPAPRAVHYRDGKSVVRLVQDVPGWRDLVDLGLAGIRACAIGSPQGTRRLLAGIDELLRLAPEDRREPLVRHRTPCSRRWSARCRRPPSGGSCRIRSAGVRGESREVGGDGRGTWLPGAGGLRQQVVVGEVALRGRRSAGGPSSTGRPRSSPGARPLRRHRSGSCRSRRGVRGRRASGVCRGRPCRCGSGAEVEFGEGDVGVGDGQGGPRCAWCVRPVERRPEVGERRAAERRQGGHVRCRVARWW
ncbi:DUF2254 family protein [Streptomyces halobius]|uniref:DUF2254 family protein n=1 Tax=Streptomyces halobius TaxID=2879846 RepID=UPI003872E6C2